MLIALKSKQPVIVTHVTIVTHVIHSFIHSTTHPPWSLLSAGSTNKDFVTRQLTGLPGKPKNRTTLSASPIDPVALSRVAKVAGLPGFMLTRPKCTVPSFSSIGLTRSESPILTYFAVQCSAVQWRRGGILVYLHHIMLCHIISYHMALAFNYLNLNTDVAQIAKWHNMVWCRLINKRDKHAALYGK